MNKHIIEGRLGETLVYSIPNFQYKNNVLSWDAFRLYTPNGDHTDNEGNAYFDVPAIAEDILPDSELDIHALVSVSSEGIEIIEFCDNDIPEINLQNGDIVADICLPATGEPIIHYKEILHEG